MEPKTHENYQLVFPSLFRMGDTRLDPVRRRLVHLLVVGHPWKPTRLCQPANPGQSNHANKRTQPDSNQLTRSNANGYRYPSHGHRSGAL